MLDIDKFQKHVYEWQSINFPQSPGPEIAADRMFKGIVEELGELAHADLKQAQGIRTNEDHDAARLDAIGDMVVYICQYCSERGIVISEAILAAFKEIAGRDWVANPETGTTEADFLGHRADND